MCLFKKKKTYKITYEIFSLKKCMIVEATNIAKAFKKVQSHWAHNISIISWEIIE